MVGFIEILTFLTLILFILFLATKGDFSVKITDAFGRANPRIQFRCKPYFNGRLAGSPVKAIKKLEGNKIRIKVRLSAFRSMWYALPIPKEFKTTYEYPDTDHKEGLIVIQEFQPDVRADDPQWDFYKDMIYNHLNQLGVLKKQLSTIKEQIESGSAGTNYALNQIKAMLPIVEKLYQSTEKKREDLSTLIVETPSTPKTIEKPSPPSGQIR